MHTMDAMAETPSDRISNGELHRLFERIERSVADFRLENKSDIRRMSADIQLALNELRETRVRVAASEFDISELHTENKDTHAEIKSLESKLNDTVKNAAFISGGIAALAYLGKYLKFWEH